MDVSKHIFEKRKNSIFKVPEVLGTKYEAHYRTVIYSLIPTADASQRKPD